MTAEPRRRATQETCGRVWRPAQAVEAILEQAPPRGMTRQEIADSSVYRYGTILSAINAMLGAGIVEACGSMGTTTPGVERGYKKLYRLRRPARPSAEATEAAQNPNNWGNERYFAITAWELLQQGPSQGMTIAELADACIYSRWSINRGVYLLVRVGIAEKGGKVARDTGGFQHLYRLKDRSPAPRLRS